LPGGGNSGQGEELGLEDGRGLGEVEVDLVGLLRPLDGDLGGGGGGEKRVEVLRLRVEGKRWRASSSSFAVCPFFSFFFGAFSGPHIHSSFVLHERRELGALNGDTRGVSVWREGEERRGEKEQRERAPSRTDERSMFISSFFLLSSTLSLSLARCAQASAPSLLSTTDLERRHGDDENGM